MKKAFTNITRYEPVLGFNTKQWWVYDNIRDIYIDPPTTILNSLPSWKEDPEKSHDEFKKIIDTEPAWLNDKEYWYEGEI